MRTLQRLVIVTAIALLVIAALEYGVDNIFNLISFHGPIIFGVILGLISGLVMGIVRTAIAALFCLALPLTVTGYTVTVEFTPEVLILSVTMLTTSAIVSLLLISMMEESS